jgi:hypothetical protein
VYRKIKSSLSVEVKRRQRTRDLFAYVWPGDQAKESKKRGGRIGDQMTCSRGPDA